MRTESVNWDDFFNTPTTSYVQIKTNSSMGDIPSDAGGGKFDPGHDIWPEVIEAADWTALGILVVTGFLWMFGNRSVAIKRLIDMAIGLEVIIHAPAILRWLLRF